MAVSDRISQVDKGLMGLRTLILNGEFPANARLPEESLAKRLGVSRTPLRQAMTTLVEEGLLERGETGGCRVVTFTTNDIMDAIEIRGVLEGTAVRLAAERGASDENLEKGHAILCQLDEALAIPSERGFERYLHFNAQFHELMSTLSGSAIVSREVARASRLPLASPSAFLQGQEVMPDFQASLCVAQAQHRSILEAIENREGSRAEAIAREHARLAHKNLKFITQEQPDLVERIPGLALVEN